MSHPDDDITRDLRRELHGTFVPYDPALAQHMIAEAVSGRRDTGAALAVDDAVARLRRRGRCRRRVAGAAALQPSAKPVHPGAGPP